MNEYTVKRIGDNVAYVVSPSGKNLSTGSQPATVEVMVELLNQETAPLHEEIARLKAENERLRELETTINAIWTAQDVALQMLQEGGQTEENRRAWHAANQNANMFWATYKPFKSEAE